QVVINSDQQVVINSDQQVLITSDQQVVINSDQQVVINSDQQVVIVSEEFLFQPLNSPTLIDIQRDTNSVGDNDVDMLVMKLNGATSDSVLSLRDKGANGIFTIENQLGKKSLDWATQPSVYGMTGDGFIMYDVYDEDSYNAGGSVVYMTNAIGDVFAPAVMTFNRDTYQRDVITFFKQDASLTDSTVYSAGSGIDDATWDGYTIGQLFQAVKNMGFLA
ncbi:MAG: hypothetical protein LC105_06215, partial [Chitinophagales bacterium]|nr:hypothetical protein [Chitinophagales bacterium]